MFVYPDALEKYKIAVEESIYKTVENNSDGKRKQDLPIVSEVNVEDGTKSTFKIGEEEKESLEFKATWSYEEDYGYDKAAKVTLVKVDDKFFVVEYKVEE